MREKGEGGGGGEREKMAFFLQGVRKNSNSRVCTSMYGCYRAPTVLPFPQEWYGVSIPVGHVTIIIVMSFCF